MANVLIVSPVGQKHLLVIAQERRRIGDALVPEKYQPPSRLQDTNKFMPCPCAVEPVRGLRGGDKVYALISQRGCLGRSRHTSELRKGCQQTLARLTHRAVGLNADDLIAIFQQQ